MSLETEFCEYLTQGEFRAFMDLWRKQIERLGHIGGTISVPLTNQNKADIEGLMGKSYHGSHAKIAWSTLKKAITQTKFEGCDFEQVLHLYFNEEIIARKTVKERKEQAISELIEHSVLLDSSGKSAHWFYELLPPKGSVMQRIQQEYNQHPSKLKKALTWVCQAIPQLPVWHHQTENLAIFSSHITGDPHAFDYGSFPSYLLLQSINDLLHQSSELKSSMDKNEVLMSAGLYKDSASNFCMLAHLRAYEHQGSLHPAWTGFYDRYEIWNVNIGNLNAISAIDHTSCTSVIIIENPSVFQILVETGKQYHQDQLGFVCTNGQLNFCGYQLLDDLSSASLTLYYCGDMDPEGLLIADRLKQRYQDQLILWHYDEVDYMKAKSNTYASKQRCKMISQIKNTKLLEIGKQLSYEPIGYQEHLIDVYKSDVYTWQK